MDLWQNTIHPRPKRAYTDGCIPPERDFPLLCATLSRHQNKQQQLIRNIARLEKYVVRQSPYERGVDFDRDKCLDNASRKLKKNQRLLKKLEIQISALEGQIPPEMLVTASLDKDSERSTNAIFSPRHFSSGPIS